MKNAPFKAMTPRKPAKDQREKLVLIGLVDLYLQSGKPVGSNTLRENGFEHLSSATIRNYFATLEEGGYLSQQHSSGGRIPTHLAYKIYAQTFIDKPILDDKGRDDINTKLIKEKRDLNTNLGAYLQYAVECVSDFTRCAAFLSAPRFDQDFVLDVKLVAIDQNRCLCVLVTDFGLVHTEVLYAEKKLSNFSLRRIESYFRWRMTGLEKPTLSEEEEQIASRFYNEVMLRHLVGSSQIQDEQIYKTGFSKLLSYPDFNEASALASGISLFENPQSLNALIKESYRHGKLSCWIGDDVYAFTSAASACSVISIPYKIHQSVVGTLSILGPNRIPYRRLFGILQTASEAIGESLTRSVFKYKISLRKPKQLSLEHDIAAPAFLDRSPRLLLEDQTI